MKPTLHLNEDGWELTDKDGEIVDSGQYPLREDNEFIENTASELGVANYYQKPYTIEDNISADSS